MPAPVLHHNVSPLVRVRHLAEAAWVLHATQEACLSQQSHSGHRDSIMSSESLVAYWALRCQVEALRVNGPTPAHTRHTSEHGQLHPKPRQCSLLEVLWFQFLLWGLRYTGEPSTAFATARVQP